MILHLKQFSEIHFEFKIDVEGFQILMSPDWFGWSNIK